MQPDPKTHETGDLLLAQGKLTPAQLEQVRRRQQRLDLPHHRAIVDLNFASEEDTYRALARLHHLEFVDPLALNVPRAKPFWNWCPSSSSSTTGCCRWGATEAGTLAFSEPPRPNGTRQLTVVAGQASER